ncbi:hypothetical protein K0M31_017479 [Melipona bicolor]|uniref:Uncharacterized protein n=1 Tax=Melipona bicolor TaxID=60889 RepID=A0AA40G4Z0_9HYME|nr:hypothetical protein K0M31_017479 [Melipona bicolor]
MAARDFRVNLRARILESGFPSDLPVTWEKLGSKILNQMANDNRTKGTILPDNASILCIFHKGKEIQLLFGQPDTSKVEAERTKQKESERTTSRLEFIETRALAGQVIKSYTNRTAQT